MESGLYLTIKVLHVSFVVAWVGSAFLLVVKAALADRRGDQTELRYFNEDLSRLSGRVVAPLALAAGLSGFLLVWLSSWSFRELWIIIGVVGFVVTFALGVVVILPGSRRIQAMIARTGETSLRS